MTPLQEALSLIQKIQDCCLRGSELDRLAIALEEALRKISEEKQ